MKTLKNKLCILCAAIAAVCCGALGVSVWKTKAAAEVVTPSITIESNNLSYSDSIYMLYAVSNEGFDRTQNQIQLLFWEEPQAEYTYGTQKNSVTSIQTATVKGKNCLVYYSRGLAAKEMTTDLYARAYAQVNGVEYYSEVNKFSVFDYVYTMRDSVGVDANTDALFTKMLEYGAAAQVKFNYQTDKLANAPYYKVTVENGAFEDGRTWGRFYTNETVTLVANPAPEGKVFAYWVNGLGGVVCRTESYTTTVSANDNYTAVYEDVDAPVASQGLQFALNSDGISYYVSGIGSCTDLALVIPAIYNDLPVTSIGSSAFRNCSSLTSVVIPDSVTSIGYDAFYNCSSLMSVEIPDSVTSIGSWAFLGCNNLTSVYITDIEAWCNISFDDGDSNPLYYANNLYLNNELVTELVIPNSVTSIGQYAFENCSSLTSVAIPDSVTSIGMWAFSNCDSLTSVEIPDRVTSIGWGVFSNCSSLTSVVIGDGVTSIGSRAFEGCSSLMSVVIGDGVTSIAGGAFKGCSSLEEITIPFVGGSKKTASDTYQYPFGYIFGTSSYEGGTATEQHYYGSSTSSTTYATYYIPTSLKKVTVTGGDILYGAFYGCSNLTSVVIPDSATSIGDYAFSNCDSLTSVEIPDGVTSIGNYAFESCDSLTSVVIGNGVTSIGAGVFAGCSSLTSIEIPDSVTSIGYGVFMDCSSLTSVVIPDGVTRIGLVAFSTCNKLTSVYYKGTAEEWANVTIDSGNAPLTDATRYYYSENEPAFNSEGTDYDNKYWHYVDGEIVVWDFANHVHDYEEEVTQTPTCEEDGVKTFTCVCGDLYTEVIPATGHTTDDGICENCGKQIGTPKMVLANFTFGENGAATHKDGNEYKTNVSFTDKGYTITLTNLSKVYGPAFDLLGNSAIKLGTGDYTASFTFTVPDEVISVVIEIAKYKTNATIVDINGVQYTLTKNSNAGEYDAIKVNTTEVKTITVSTTNSGKRAMVNTIVWYGVDNSSQGLAYSLNSDGEGYTVSGIGECTDTDIIIPAEYMGLPVTAIGKNAFDSCSSLTSVAIPDSVTSIGDFAFMYCYGLTSITILDSVTSIGEWAFYYCKSLTSVVIPDSVTSIGDYAFWACSSLTSVVIGDGVTSIGRSAFYNCSSLTNVYYKGTAEEWANVTIDSGNAPLTDATRYYYSENEPAFNSEGTDYDNNYWHYVDGEIVVWVYVPHTHEYEETVTLPTCTEDGYTTHTCTICGDTYTDDIVDAIGHVDGDADYKCDGCAIVLEPVDGEALTVAQAIALGEALGSGKYSTNKYYVTVTIVSVANAEYGNLNVVDTAGDTYYIYGTYMGEVRYDAFDYKPIAGDEITLYGAVGSYYNYNTQTLTYQMKSAQVDEIVMHEHIGGEGSVTEPTCTEKGYTTYTCTLCGMEFTGNEVPATGHSYEEEVTEPTCTEEGYTTYTCACGDSYVDNYTEPTGHDYVEGKCDCGAEDPNYAAHVHNYVGVETAPTCTTDGYTTYTCACGDTYKGNTVSATGHNHEATVTEPTCTEEGYTTYTCACGDTYKGNEVGAKGHSYEETMVDATCEKDGLKTYTCACGDTYSEVISATGHSTDNGVCEYCGETISALVEKSYSYTFTSKQYTANGAKSLGGVNWTLAGGGSYWGYDGTKGQQFGSASKPYKSMTLTSTSFSNVSKITLNTSGASSIKGTCKVYVGDTLLTTISLTETAESYTIDAGGLTGAIRLEYTQTSSKAIYIKSIAVTYAE